jgi:alpha-amylase
MKRSRLWLMRILPLLLVVLLALAPSARGQSGFDDDRVMLQGFYWESYRHGQPDPRFKQFGDKRWYTIVKENADELRQARFDLIWLPPPCYAGDLSAGYNPKEYFRLDNSFGSFDQHRAMLEALLKSGIEPVADVVLNHRDGSTGWVDFKNPEWGLWAICGDDEAFSNPNSPAVNTPVEKRGAPEEMRFPYGGRNESDYAYDAFRDLDHTNVQVRRDILKYLLLLKSAGYRGWRYDMVHGYHANWLAIYNKRTNPTFSVGEYDWDKENEQRGWIWYSAATAGDLKTSSNVFDFTTQFTLKDNKGNYRNWYAFGNGTGLMGDNTDNLPWKQRAVTFLENHDTGYRTNEDGSPQNGHTFDNFQNNWEVEQAYAFILTHPGVPCVFWKHYFDWSKDLRFKIRALINARKVAGVTSGSVISTQNNARDKGVYAAMIAGKNGALYVRVGGSDNDWNPSMSNYSDYREYAFGAGWKVWVKLAGNPDFQQVPLKPPFAIPAFLPPDKIDVPADWANP